MNDNTPSQLELDMMHVYNGLQHMMDTEATKNMKHAIETLKERGAPDSSTYSLTHITAEDDDDLNLKMHLATIQPFKDFVDEKISQQEALNQVMPILNALLPFMMKVSIGDAIISDSSELLDYPITINVEE